MRIWFVELGEPLPFQTGQRLLRYGELTKVLANRGHEVTWWACDFSHQTREYIGAPNARVEWDGISVVLVHGTGYFRNTGVGRLRHVAVHASNLARLIEGESRPDIIITAMPTIEASLVASRYARTHDVPLIVDVRDEWPEDYVRWLPRFLQPLGRLALAPKFGDLRRVCRSAISLSAVTERQLSYGLSFAGRDRQVGDAVFPTGARRTPFDSDRIAERVAVWRARGLLPDDFVCVFTGTMSASRRLDAILEAVRSLSTRLPIRLVLAGKGDRERQYKAEAAGAPNIIFAGWIDALEMAALNEIADVLLAPYSPDFGFSLPTKIFDYLAAGRPLLSSCPGEAALLLAKERFGMQFSIDDAEGVAQALVYLHDNPAERAQMGARARALFEREFALENILERYANHIERTAAMRTGRAA